MTMFKCNTCNRIYEDYYPPDDTCIKCKKGFVRIINLIHEHQGLSTDNVDKSPVAVDMSHEINISIGTLAFCIKDGQSL